MYWSLNVVVNQAFCFLSIYLYGQYSKEANETVVELLWKLVGGLFVISMLNFALFLRSVNQEYISTFFSPITGKRFAVLNYEEAKTDSVKFEIFGHHSHYYDSINEELMKWLNDNWSKWEESSPDGFTAEAIATIPPDLLPARVLEGMGGLKGRKVSIQIMEKEKKTMKKKQSVRGADLKIIPDVVRVEELVEEG